MNTRRLRNLSLALLLLAMALGTPRVARADPECTSYFHFWDCRGNEGTNCEVCPDGFCWTVVCDNMFAICCSE
jgi:hypothetical protein